MIWQSSARPMSRAQPPSRSRPFFHVGGRIVDIEARPLILLRNGRGGTQLDFVSGREGERVHLESGNTILGRYLIAPAAADVPQAFPYWGGSGIGLWEAVAARLTPAAIREISANPGRSLTREQLRSLLTPILDDGAKGKSIIIGRESPLRADHPAVRLDMSAHAVFEWDVVTEQAVPRSGSEAIPFLMVRILTPDEWAAHAGARPGRSKVPTRARPSQQSVNAWMLAYYQDATDNGRSLPKRENDAMPACAESISATQEQMREALRLLPAELKRPRGGRNR